MIRCSTINCFLWDFVKQSVPPSQVYNNLGLWLQWCNILRTICGLRRAEYCVILTKTKPKKKTIIIQYGIKSMAMKDIYQLINIEDCFFRLFLDYWLLEKDFCVLIQWKVRDSFQTFHSHIINWGNQAIFNITKMESIGVDLQLQIYILASVFGAISIILIFFLAGVCGQLSKVKRQQQKLYLEQLGQNA